MNDGWMQGDDKTFYGYMLDISSILNQESVGNVKDQ